VGSNAGITLLPIHAEAAIACARFPTESMAHGGI
jgi:hypothetical protein